MVFKEIGNEYPEEWKPVNNGDQITGAYIEKKQEVGQNKANVYIIEVDGKQKSVWGSTVLDDKMLNVSPGKLIRVTYQGVDTKKNYKKFKLEVDDGEQEEQGEEPQ